MNLHNSLVETHQKKQEGKKEKYYPCEIRRSASYTCGQNAQSNLSIS